VTFPYASDFERNEGDGTVNGTVNGTVKNDLSETQKSILLLINANKGITIDKMATEMAVSRRTILRNIKILTEKNIIKREGSDKTGQWVT
jgi:predicted HTH transcriptional regulator